MIKILYVHGYLGSGNGHASACVKSALEKRNILFKLDAPQFDVTDPDGMFREIRSRISKYDVLVASSMGAFYAMQITGIPKILINTAFPETMAELNRIKPEEEKDPKITPDYLAAISELRDAFFREKINDALRKDTYLIFGKNDAIAQNEEFLSRYYESTHIAHVNMEHRLTEVGAEMAANIIVKLETEMRIKR